MRLGVTTMNSPSEVRPEVLARALEDRGFDSWWIGEHSHIPASRRTPYPAGGELPAPYLEMMNPFISLALAASVTTELLIGTGVVLPLEHDLFDLAKSVATLDVLSDGRVQLGVGVGWNEEELANHRQIPWNRRYRALGECVGALKALWTQDDAEFHGELFDFDPVWSYPKPLQRPHPPILCGTGGRLGTQHALRWADGWMPMDIALGDVPRKVAKFRAAAVDAGRGDLPISIVTYGEPTLDRLRQYADLGVERAIIGAARDGWDDPATVMAFVDRAAGLVDRLA